MSLSSEGAARKNNYALVAYIPDPLGKFLDLLRGNLEPGTLNPRAHVTLLPPRPLPEGVARHAAFDFIRNSLAAQPAFELRIGDIEVFPGSNVVYASIESGFDVLRAIHNRLNAECVGCQEKFNYHPHVTLAQNLTEAQAHVLAESAAASWRSWKSDRSFLVDTLTFVQERADKRWDDLEVLSLSPLISAKLAS